MNRAVTRRRLGLAVLALGLLGVTPADAKDPMFLFRARCAQCHGNDGRAQTETGIAAKIPDFTSDEFQRTRTDAGIRETITKGRLNTKMEGWAGKLTAEEIDSLARVVRGFKKPAPR